MPADDQEEQLLRSVALQNAQSILVARQRAERELLEAQAALRRKSEELANSLAMMRATLESTTDGILVVDAAGTVTGFNEQFARMWRIPPEIMNSHDRQQLLAVAVPQLTDPEKFLATTQGIYQSNPAESFDLIEFKDGRVFERGSKIQQIDDRAAGRVWSYRDVTANKRAEEELRRQREWFQVTLSSIGDAVITTDTDAKVTFLNPVAEKLTGWSSGEASGHALEEVFKIINEQTREPAPHPVSKVLAGEGTVALINHTALISKDGRETAIEDSAAPITDAQGNVSGAVMVFHDVTQRRRAQEALRASHDQFSAILNQSPVGIYLVDSRLRIRLVNPKARPTFGNVGELAGRDLGEILRLLWLADVAEDVVGRFRRTLETGEPFYSRDFAELRENHRVQEHYDWELHRLTLPDGQYGVVCYFIDISAHVLAQEALQRSEQELRALADSIPQLAWVAHPDGHIFWYNRGWYDYTGTTLELMQGWGWQSVHDPAVLPRVLDRWNQSIRTGEPFEMEFPLRGANGAFRWFLTRVNPVRDEAGRVVRWFGTNTDVDEVRHAQEALQDEIKERRRAEEQLAAARDVAETANEAKDHFIAALSHELRTPLTPVLAILSSLRDDAALPEELAQDLETVRRNVELEARLIDDLLDLTRVTRGKLELKCERRQIGPLIEEAIKTCLPDLEAKRLKLARKLEDPHQAIVADSARITQILWNLLKNAIKFTPEGGTITIRSHSTIAPPSEVTFEVEDTGIGISPAHLPRVFEAFEQGDRRITRQFGGLGLGLAISKAIAECHGGRLTAASDGIGCGSTFKLILPVRAPEESPGSIVAESSGVTFKPPEASVADRPLRVLLVEDHADTAAILTRLLRRMGHDVIQTESIAATLAAAEKEMRIAPIDVVMSDLGLPDGSGLELMRELSTRHGLRGIALSGFGMDSDREQSKAAGFSHHLVKPVDIALVRSILAEVAKGA